MDGLADLETSKISCGVLSGTNQSLCAKAIDATNPPGKGRRRASSVVFNYIISN